MQSMASAGSLHPQVYVDHDAVNDEIDNAGRYKPDADDQRLLRANQKIFEVWPEPPPDTHLHIFVTLPGGPTLVEAVGVCFKRLSALVYDI